MHYIIYTDGGARGNPGPSGAGAVIKDGETGRVLREIAEPLGHNTNNYAEYMALVLALEGLKKIVSVKLRKAVKVEIKSDSELLIKQMRGEYMIENKVLQELFVRIWNLRVNFPHITFTHVRREDNKEADRLSNLAMDKN